MMLTHLTTAGAAAQWLGERVTGTLRSDSRQVERGDGFLAWPGYAHDARRFVGSALQAGAAACLVDADRAGAFGWNDPRIATVPALKQHSGAIASAFFGRPSARLKLVATTGTNGKTSTTWWVAQALGHLGRRCAVVGTLGVGEPRNDSGALASTGLTTPDAVLLQATLRRLVDQGFEACAIEASSIGLDEHRLDGSTIAVAMFTNLSLDHLDYHGSMAEYWRAKRALFGWPGLESAVLNIDDAHGAALAEELHASPLALWTCSLQRDARLRATGLHYADGGLAFELHEGDSSLAVRTTLIGDFNAANLLLVIGALRALGVSRADAARAASALGPVPGRMQRVNLPDAPKATLPEVIVDYAHSPDALDKALLALAPFARSRGGTLWCVFGCGGNRDSSKRPLMGACAERLASHVVLTSDNPRNEPPLAILEQILGGIADREAVAVIEDRRAAIEHAVREASGADVILLAGKGHETRQVAGGLEREFSDLLEARRALGLRARVAA